MQNTDYILDRLCEGVSPEVIEQVVCLIKADEIRKGLECKPKTKPMLEKPPVLYIGNKKGNYYLSLSKSAVKLAGSIPLIDRYAKLSFSDNTLKIALTDRATKFKPSAARLRDYHILTIHDKVIIQYIIGVQRFPEGRITCPVEWNGTSWIADLENYVCE